MLAWFLILTKLFLGMMINNTKFYIFHFSLDVFDIHSRSLDYDKTELSVVKRHEGAKTFIAVLLCDGVKYGEC